MQEEVKIEDEPEFDEQPWMNMFAPKGKKNWMEMLTGGK